MSAATERWRAKMRAEGRCPGCGEKATPGKTSCAACLAAEQARYQARRGPDPRRPYTCSRCDGPGHGARTCKAEIL